MTTASGLRSRTLFALARTVLAAIALAACSAGASPATTSPTSAPPIASAGPADSAGGTSPGGDVGPGGGDELVVPKPGQLDVHPISSDALTAEVGGHRVIVTITYTSGVEPCSVLDTIVVECGKGSFAITLREGHGPGDQVCIMIAKIMKTQADLGDLAPGTYTISDATGGAAAIQVVVN